MDDAALQRRRRQGGGVIVEFSVSVMVLWLILAATLDFGRAFAASHLLQSAARTASRELALRDDLAWDATFDVAIGRIFDASYLVVDATRLEEEALKERVTPGEFFEEVLRSNEGRDLVLNRMLRPLMIYEEVTVAGQQRRLLRYPGALLTLDDQPTRAEEDIRTPFTVAIPVIDAANGKVVLHGVVEELERGAFSLRPEGGDSVPPGTASVRLHYPFQAVGLTGWRIVDGFNRAVRVGETDGYQVEQEGDLQASTIEALDAMGPDGELQAYVQSGAGDPIPLYGGQLGLGAQGVLGQTVRPFRRVITAQAIAPREIVSVGGSS